MLGTDVPEAIGTEDFSAVGTSTSRSPSHSYYQQRNAFLRENPDTPDLYETLPRNVKYLVRELLKDVERGSEMVVWECCSGNGAITNLLTNYNIAVTSSDLNFGEVETRVDFLTCDIPPNVTHIITNPPYANKSAFILRAFHWHVTQNVKVALLLPIESLMLSGCVDIWETVQMGVVYPPAKFLHDGVVGRYTGGIAWFFWGWGFEKNLFFIRCENETDDESTVDTEIDSLSSCVSSFKI